VVRQATGTFIVRTAGTRKEHLSKSVSEVRAGECKLCTPNHKTSSTSQFQEMNKYLTTTKQRKMAKKTPIELAVAPR
jgi:hypothetical protein